MTTWAKRGVQMLGVTEYRVGAGLDTFMGRFASSDQHGNALGDEYDLVENGAVGDARMSVPSPCRERNLTQPRISLEKKGLVAEEHSSVAGRRQLSEWLSDDAEFRLISDSAACLEDASVTALDKYFKDSLRRHHYRGDTYDQQGGFDEERR